MGAKPFAKATTQALSDVVDAGLGGVDVLEPGGDRAREAVGAEHAEERAGQGRGHVLADLLDRAGDRAHRDDDAEHGRHDADAGQRVAHPLHGRHRHRLLLVVHVDLAVHERLEVVRRHAADQHEPQRVAQEDDRVVVLQDLRVAREERALLRVLDVGLDRHQAVAPGDLEELEHHLEHVEVERLAEGRGLDELGQLARRAT